MGVGEEDGPHPEASESITLGAIALGAIADNLSHPGSPKRPNIQFFSEKHSASRANFASSSGNIKRDQINSLGTPRVKPDDPETDVDTLSDKEREKIRRGVILLQDAYQGRASHGLFSLLDGAAWKRVLFVIHTNDWWGTFTISASCLHAGLILCEASTYRAAWRDPALNTPLVCAVEAFCIVVYMVDIAMKMLYFGGWRDYVSKGWQRMYVQIVAAMIADWLLFYLGLCPLRFSRPIRLTILCGRHRDVRRIGAFLPVMGQRLLTTFAAPMMVLVTIFGVLSVKLYGELPERIQEPLQGYDFDNSAKALRTFFMLSTSDNFDPVVLNLYRYSPNSFFMFLVFIVIAGFFLMSVSIGVIGDVYNEDQEERKETEKKKAKKSLKKAFDKLDIKKQGHIPLSHFLEMMRHIRPDKGVKHHTFAYSLITHEKGVLDEKAFQRMKHFLEAQFVMECRFKEEDIASFWYWKWCQTMLVRVDTLLLAVGIDHWQLFSITLAPGIAVPIQIGTVLVGSCCLCVAGLGAAAPKLFMQKYRKPWRQADLSILVVCSLAHCLYISCASGRHMCESSTKIVWEALAAVRVLRMFILHGPARLYLKAVWDLAELIKFFMGVVATYNYMFAVVGMEVMAPDPARSGGKDVPSYDGFPNAFVTTFSVFIGQWNDVLRLQDEEGPWWLAAIVSVFLIVAYSVMTIGLYNLLTNIVVDFNSVLQEAAKQNKTTKFAKMEEPIAIASVVSGPASSPPDLVRTHSQPNQRGMTRGKSFISNKSVDSYEMLVVRDDQDCVVRRYLVTDL